MTSVDRTAYPAFARVVSARELAESFTPAEAEIEWARGRTQDERHLLALAVWLRSYQRLGYFPKVEDVPAVVVDHVRGALRWAWPRTCSWSVRLRGRPSGIASSCARAWGRLMRRPGSGRSPRRRSARRCSPRTTRPT
ncbi:DUF4158 domain-containing protein [Actinomadura sp. 9N215]|uniref:DUF4158 domain-containing protein n=1 Tax=Actinomadura sp. 9N215 TaxID=3375150 RepID=UPI0037AD22F6